jgi:hypothetical protein
MSIQIVLMLPPEDASVSLARHALSEALRLANVALDCAHEALVALSEACTRISQQVSREDNYEVLLNVGDQQLTMHVLNPGAGSFHRFRADLADLVPQDGHGLELISAFTDKASFDDDGSSLHLVKRLRFDPDAELPPAS